MLARRAPGTERTPLEASVLFLRLEDRAASEGRTLPACFGDLNLDQVVAAVTAGRGEYDLPALGGAPRGDEDAVRFRQEVFSDLEPKGVREAVGAFAATMRSVRGVLGQTLSHRYQQETWHFEAAETYARGVTGLVTAFEGIVVRSRGLIRFREYLATYCGSQAFQSLVAEATRVREALAGVRYNLPIRGGRVAVGTPDPGPDYTAQIEAAFERFRRGAVRDYLATFSVDPDLSHVGILDRIALLYPDAFRALDEFFVRHGSFADPTIAAFDREVQFYLAYLEFIDRLRSGDVRSRPGLEARPPGRRGRPQRLPPDGPGARDRGHRAQPGRQDDLRARVRPASLPRRPGLPRTRRGGRAAADRRGVRPLRPRGAARRPARQARGRGPLPPHLRLPMRPPLGPAAAACPGPGERGRQRPDR